MASLSKTYQKKTDREHILDAPDTYIGSIEEDNIKNWIYDETDNKMVHRDYNWVPGLYKCFDEGIVNARDHYIRMEQKLKSMTQKDAKSHYPVKQISALISFWGDHSSTMVMGLMLLNTLNIKSGFLR